MLVFTLHDYLIHNLTFFIILLIFPVARESRYETFRAIKKEPETR